MGRSTGWTAAVVSATAIVAFPSVSQAAAPPDPNDPCSRAGRDTCGTLGVGYYRTYRYGLRWFGDYRGIVPRAAHTFCLDLGYWYASPRYRYRPARSARLRARDGRLVPLERRRRIAYAIWRYGRSSKPDRQAAVMLYVHAQMGDARPGEVDPAALGPKVAALYRRIARDAPRYHGPYRIETRLPDRLTVARPARAEIRVLSAAGRPLPHVRLTLTASAAGVPAKLRTSGSGVARLSLTPTSAEGVRLRVATEQLAAPQPRVYVPSTAAAARNGQRLAVPAGESVTATETPVVQARPRLSTVVSDQLVRPGARIFDRVRVEGLGATPAAIEVELYGPFGTRSAIRCTPGRLHWRGRVAVRGDGEVRTPPVRLARAGFYGYRERLAGTASVVGTETPCAPEAETSLAVPRIVTGGRRLATPVRARAAGARTPVRIRIPAVGVDAPVAPAGIDTKRGELGIPADIDRVAWWRDGAAPGSQHGSVLLAGHVDSARRGPGAFFRLGRARRGDLARLTTAAGRVLAYRVASVRSYRKGALPESVFARTGRARLVLVTCGGPFDEASGHYRDVVVVTALPGRP